jgi:hypothetical protein
MFALAFLKDAKGKYIGTEWRRFKSLDEVKAVAKQARAEKDTWYVKMGKKRRKVPRKVIQFPVPPVRTETSPPCEDRKVANAG